MALLAALGGRVLGCDRGVGVRDAFISTLEEVAGRDARVVLLTGDLGWSVLEPFAERFPDRFYNVGVAEQNMVGIATGLAESGLIPFVYSIATFASLRPYEFVRNGPAVHDLPVRVVGVGGGFAYGTNGISHYALEDVAVMHAQPNMRIVVPADRAGATEALLQTWDLPGPAYYRLGKSGETAGAPFAGGFRLGRVRELVGGEDVLLVALGPVVSEALGAASALAGAGVSCGVVLVETVRPFPEDDLADALARVPLAVAVEAHYRDGGLGSLLGAFVAERGLGCRLVRCGVETLPNGITGSERFMLDAHGLSSERLADRVLAAIGEPATSREA